MPAAAIGGCLSASLTLCLNKARLDPDAVNAHVTAPMGRNDAGRLRIEGIDVELTPCLVSADDCEASRLGDSLLVRAGAGVIRRTIPPAIRQTGP